MKYRLSLCSIMKNEQKNVLEWVSYHHVIGVDHFYIYDNDENSGMETILKKYVDSGIVTINKILGEVKQLPAYNSCLQTYSNDSKYIGFIDADEFLVPIEDVNVADLVDQIIEGYRSKDPRVVGLVVKWAVYGWGNHVSRPEGLVIENYLYREDGDLDKHIKSIVNPRRARKFFNPHFCSFYDEDYAVSERGNKVKGPFMFENFRDKIRINHYYYKSIEDFRGRIQKKRSDVVQTTKQMEDRIQVEMPSLQASDNEYDPIMLRYVDRVKEEMQKYS